MQSPEYFPAVFSRHAAAYQERIEEVMRRGEARGRQALLDWLDPQPGQKALDVACGPGTLTLRLAAAVSPGGEVLGVDLAPGMVDVARAAAAARALPARFEIMDIQHLDLPAAGFDLAACGHGLQFVPDLAGTLSGIRRVLKAGGRFAASIPVDSEPSPAFVIVYQLLSERAPAASVPEDRERTVATVHDPERLVAAAHAAGFAEARSQLHDEVSVWENPQRMVDRAASWWSVAARLELLPAAEADALKREAVARITAELGPGQLSTESRTLVLLTTA